MTLSPSLTTLLVALVGVLGTVLSPFVAGWFSLRIKQREADTTQPLEAWKQWREDNNILRVQISDLRAEILRLETKIDEMGESRSKLLEERERAIAERDHWRGKYEQERVLSNVFLTLYESLDGGRVPDAVMLDSIRRELREAGYLPLARPVPAATDALPAPAL